MQVRIANSRDELAGTAWTGPSGAGSWFTEPQLVPADLSGHWLQYRLALGARNAVASPRIREVSIRYAETVPENVLR